MQLNDIMQPNWLESFILKNKDEKLPLDRVLKPELIQMHEILAICQIGLIY